MSATSRFSWREYQADVASAILRSVHRGDGLSFSVQMCRQAGKNETSAQIELRVLGRYMARPSGRMGVKAAPTWNPQALISLRRLRDRLRQSGLDAAMSIEAGYIVRLGFAGFAFLSAGADSNIVGHTADLLLEFDEAQDLDAEKVDKELLPMAAARNATRVYYGTAWDDQSVLERAKQEHLRLERKDGIRRHFEVDWRVVAAASPEYRRFVEGERARLGADHPLFLTQYENKPIAGKGRMFTRADLSLLQGAHGALTGPRPGEAYVAGLDVAGDDETPAQLAVGRDSTVLSIGRVVMPAGVGDEAPHCELVALYAWTGTPVRQLWGQLAQLLGRTWRVGRAVVDATGVGDAVAVYLQQQLGESRVERYKFTQASKSKLGFDLLAAVRRGGVRIFASDSSPEFREFWRQIEHARAEYLPNQTLRFYVAEADGHDDYLVSLALLQQAVEAPRVARGRRVS